MQLRTAPIVEAFDGVLELIEDEAQRERFSRVLVAGRPAVERAAYDLVSEVVREINEQLGEGVQVQLAYEPGGVSVSVAQVERDEAVEALAIGGDEVERLTLRLPAEVKEQASGVAADAAVSLNTWIVQSVARALARAAEDGGRGSGRRRRSRGRGRSLKGRVGS